MNAQEIISSGILELYASGLASADETAQVQQWIQQYPEVKAELDDIQLGLENYALAHAVAPEAGAKEKLFAAINAAADKTITAVPLMQTTNGVAAPVVPIKNYWKWVAAAAVVLLVGSTILNVTYYNKYNTAAKAAEEKDAQLAAINQKEKSAQSDLDVVNNKYSLPVNLNGQQNSPDAKAKIFWMTNTGDVMIDASNLPDAPAGMQYQFWAIVDGKPVDGGLIITTDKGKKYHFQKMKAFGRAEAFAISLEKEGGNPVPTKVVSTGAVCKI
ncbi:MAG: anti-sigma factor [Bacteroidetes bacterium]|nr:anti-sigma factor [Bacteroidota bacterium]